MPKHMRNTITMACILTVAFFCHACLILDCEEKGTFCDIVCLAFSTKIEISLHSFAITSCAQRVSRRWNRNSKCCKSAKFKRDTLWVALCRSRHFHTRWEYAGLVRGNWRNDLIEYTFSVRLSPSSTFLRKVAAMDSFSCSCWCWSRLWFWRRCII